ncbi:MAG: VWA domain-containing protein [Deltaproteobacteria bacterium]|nr:VWA domain-containing protein [Deltaproteobacteria bacterium]
MARQLSWLGGWMVAGLLVACSAGGGGLGEDLSGTGGSTSQGGSGGVINTEAGTGGMIMTEGGGGVVVDPDSACLTQTFGAQAKPANLLFQLDTTRSMNCPLAQPGCMGTDPSTGTTRWNVFRDKLKAALDKIPKYNSCGMMHYPTNVCGALTTPKCSTADQCVAESSPDVELSPLSEGLAAIQAKIDAIVPNGVTPTRAAFQLAANYVESENATGDKYVVLATDGLLTMCVGCTQDSSCDLDAENAALASDVKSYANKGIKTFVIGVPGSSGYADRLTQLAENGGTARPGCNHTKGNYCHFDLSDATNDFGDLLSQALAAIAGEALSCVYDIPGMDAGAFDKNKVNVQFTSSGTTEKVLRDSSRTDGWDYSDDGTQIILYGPACDAAKTSTDGTISILYGCPTLVK